MLLSSLITTDMFFVLNAMIGLASFYAVTYLVAQALSLHFSKNAFDALLLLVTGALDACWYQGTLRTHAWTPIAIPCNPLLTVGLRAIGKEKCLDAASRGYQRESSPRRYKDECAGSQLEECGGGCGCWEGGLCLGVRGCVCRYGEEHDGEYRAECVDGCKTCEGRYIKEYLDSFTRSMCVGARCVRAGTKRSMWAGMQGGVCVWVQADIHWRVHGKMCG